MKIIYLFFILSFLFCQDEYSEFIITPENTEFGNSVGGSVSILNGDLFVHRGTPSGKVCDIYQLIENEWMLYQTIDNGTWDTFHYQQIDEDMFIRSFRTFGIDKIQFYEKSEIGNWVSITIISSPVSYPYHDFGAGFFRNDNLLITISNSYIVNHGWVTRLFVYEFDGFSWQLEYTYDPDESHINPNGLYIDDDVFIIGFPNHNISDEDTKEGAIQFFHNVDGIWEPGEYMLANNPTPGANFGHGIIMNGDELIITAPFENEERGIVYIYQNVDEEWTEVQSIQSSDIEPFDNFGYDIALHGDYLIAGGKKNDDAGSISGSAYIFKKNENGLWVQIRKILSSDLAAVDLYGASVDIDDTHIVVGAPFKNGLLGSVYVYELEDTMLHSNFATYPVTGNAPLSLNFNDLSQGNPTSWQWDFDSDGIIDSEEQYPEFTYEFSGDYSVTLTVSNGESTSTFTKENYISVTGGLAYGDLNDDAIVNVLDILIMVDIIMGDINPTESQIEAADMNNSGTIDIIDIVMVVNEILGELE